MTSQKDEIDNLVKENKQEPNISKNLPEVEPEIINDAELTKALNESLNNTPVGVDETNKVDNPFVELRQLISAMNIDVKTILTEKQVIRLHQLDNLNHLFIVTKDKFRDENKDTKRIENLTNVIKVVDNFTNRFMTLVINKDGQSRQQFIEALHKGAEKAEESKRQSLQEKFSGIMA